MAPLGIGERLRDARVARGLSLEEIEAATRIRRRFLEALETERFDQLPGPAYVRAFLGAYAGHLGLPAAELIALYPAVESAIRPSASALDVRITPAMPRSRLRRIVSAVAVVLAVGAALLAYTLYDQLRQFAGSRPPAAHEPAAAPPPQASGAPGASGAPAQPAAPPPSAPQPTAPPAGGTPSGGTSVPGGTPPAAAPTAPSPSAPGSPPAAGVPNPAAVAAGPIHMEVMATDRSWVRAVADGVTVFEGFLSAGDHQTWEARRQLSLRIGNASALDVSVNGHGLGRLGNPGDVWERTFAAGPPTP